MLKTYLLAAILSLILTIIGGIVTLPILRKIGVGQPILKYVEMHKKKSGTPTMGGIFFMLSSLIIYLAFFGIKKRLGLVAIIIGIAFMIVGFTDDFIKIKYNKNEGLTPLQKILFQSGISIFAGVFCYYNGIVSIYIPFYKTSVYIGIFIIPLVAFVFLAVVNCVNLTDGLDGLAGGVSLCYFIWIALLISTQTYFFMGVRVSYENQGLVGLSTILVGSLGGFLFFNQNKAKVFMGDTGSLALGGIIGAVSVFSGNVLFVAVIGFAFVLSGISVILQVLYYKKTKKRIFLMAPIHHHFQLKGFSETQISYTYSLLTCILGALSLIFYL